MPKDIEQMLERAFRHEAQSVEASFALVESTVSLSRSRRLRRRRQFVVLSVAAAITAVVGIAAVPSLTESDRQHAPKASSTPSTSSTPADEPPQGFAWTWAMALPKQPTPNIAILIGRKVYVGSNELRLPQRYGRVWARVEGGLLVTSSNGWSSREAGILAADGTFTPYSQTPGSRFRSGTVVSPDGRLVILGDDVVDTASGSTVPTPLPRNAFELEVWTTAGIVYRNVPGELWLWSLGAQSPLPISGGHSDQYLGWWPFNVAGIGITKNQDCVTLHRLHRDASVIPVREICDEGLAYPSLDGSLVATSSGRVLDLASGRQVGELALPDSVRRIPPGTRVTWDSTDALVFTVTDRSILFDRYPPTVLVRCPINGHDCQRLTDRLLDVSGGYAYPVPLR